VIYILVALAPVVMFLVTLFFMDSFRLVRPGAIAVALVYGAAVAIVSFVMNRQIQLLFHLSPAALTRYFAPVLEESAKAGLIALWLKKGRVGFLVDAAIQGFAVGTGFALVENTIYLQTIPGSLALWMVRGFGTAMLQGGTTAIFAMLANTGADRRPDRLAVAFLPGYAAAIAIHSTFNHRLLPPVAQTCVILIVLPLLMLWVFSHSEHAMRDWIGAGLDLDVELLELIGSDVFESTRMGRYLKQLRAQLPGPMVADMFCLLRLELELAVEAKAMLLARDAGLDIPADDDYAASIAELEYIRRSIGKTGLLALKPLQVSSRRDEWHRHMLQHRRSMSAR